MSEISGTAITFFLLYLLIACLAIGSVLFARYPRRSSPSIIRRWLGRRWRSQLDPALLQDYRATFSNPAGQRVLYHLMDAAYCQIYAGHDPIELATLNGRRSLVHEMLENLDMATNPDKYQTAVDAEQETLNDA